MKVFEVKGTKRTDIGKKATKALRAIDQIPCVVYGKGEENLHFYAHLNDFRHLVYTPNAYLVNLTIDGEAHKVIMQDIQFHPVSDIINHIDFLRIKDDEPVKISIPVKPVGVAKGILGGGVLNLINRKLRVSGLPADLPERLEIDVTHLLLGRSIKVSEVSFDKLEVLAPKDAVICAVQSTRAAKSAAGADGDDDEAEAETETEA